MALIKLKMKGQGEMRMIVKECQITLLLGRVSLHVTQCTGKASPEC